MIVTGWILIAIGAFVNFFAKPMLNKTKGAVDEKALYWIKITGLCLVVAGAAMIFIAGGKVDVGAIR